MASQSRQNSLRCVSYMIVSYDLTTCIGWLSGPMVVVAVRGQNCECECMRRKSGKRRERC